MDPEVHWLTLADGTRTPDLLEDRAAKYLPDQNLLQINGDFRVFTDMVDRWCERYADVPGARDVIEHVVHEWFEQALVETVLGRPGAQGLAAVDHATTSAALVRRGADRGRAPALPHRREHAAGTRSEAGLAQGPGSGVGARLHPEPTVPRSLSPSARERLQD